MSVHWLPFHDESRARRLRTTAAWLAGVAAVTAALELLGVDVRGWLSQLWDALTGIGLGYQAAGWAFQTAQTTLTALAWYGILRAAYGTAVQYRAVLASYATGVALNGVLPANLGTIVTLLMFVAIIPAANLPGVLGGAVVQKLFFSALSVFVYVYLFASVAGSFELQLPALHDHPALAIATALGAAALIAILGRTFWHRLRDVWEKAKQGGAILARPGEYLLRVALPSLGAWLAKLAVIATFLAGYGITVSFHAVMAVMGGNAIAGSVAMTPGGVGVSQAANVAALSNVTDAATANAYSLGQELAMTAWNIGFAIVMVLWAFGWAGGRVLVEQSYAGAKAKVAADRAARHPPRH
jgi:uncharacterized membrane protein YbhN (UPF0104 family)